MSELFWLSQAQFDRMKRYFPLSRGEPRVDDLRVISGIIHVIRNGLRWKDAPPEYGPYKRLYFRFLPWSQRGVFNHIFAELAADGITVDWLTIEAKGFNVQRAPVRRVRKGGMTFLHSTGSSQFDAAVTGAQGRSFVTNKNIHIHKRYTTVGLEPELQDALKEITVIQGCSIHGLCTAVYDLKKATYSFAAALRVFIVGYYRSKSKSVVNHEVSQVLERIKGNPLGS